MDQVLSAAFSRAKSGPSQTLQSQNSRLILCKRLAKLRSKWWNLLHPWHQHGSWLPNRARKYVIPAWSKPIKAHSGLLTKCSSNVASLINHKNQTHLKECFPIKYARTIRRTWPHLRKLDDVSIRLKLADVQLMFHFGKCIAPKYIQTQTKPCHAHAMSLKFVGMIESLWIISSTTRVDRHKNQRRWGARL